MGTGTAWASALSVVAAQPALPRPRQRGQEGKQAVNAALLPSRCCPALRLPSQGQALAWGAGPQLPLAGFQGNLATWTPGRVRPAAHTGWR